MHYRQFGNTGLRVPPLVFGTTSLGNLFQVLSDAAKLELVRTWFDEAPSPLVIDSAGKYGAGMALEVLGRSLSALNISAGDVIISNKLGWLRVPLCGSKPSFEPDAWMELEYDAELHISYEGILRCWEQGCQLLGDYTPRLVSVHDPDEYLAQAPSPEQRKALMRDVVEAYRALDELKRQGIVCGVGVGAKDWRVIRELADHVALDWVMLANSLTILRHPPELLAFVQQLAGSQVGIINAAVFHAGFLTGGEYFDYRRLRTNDPADRRWFEWRSRFHTQCQRYGVLPADACIRFAASPPGIHSIAVSTSRADRVRGQLAGLEADIPTGFWTALKDEGLIARDYPYLG